MKKAYLVIDLGTGNSRAALSDTKGNIIDLISFENIYHVDKSLSDAKYFLPQQWFDKIMSATSSLLHIHSDYHLIAITATSAREGIVLIDRQGNCPIGLPNIDRRGNAFAKDYLSSEEIISHQSGRWLDSLFSALKLVGYRNMYPADFSYIQSFTSLSEWIGYAFTGQIGISPSHACETQLFDIYTRDWSCKLCDIFNIDSRLLPPLLETGEILGIVQPEWLSALHLSAPVPFIVSGADTQTAAHGVNARKEDVVIVSGTTTPVISLVSSPPKNSSGKCWIDCGLHHNWMLETNAGTTGLNFQNYKKNFIPEIDYSSLEREIQQRQVFKCIASFGTKQFSENLTIKNGGFYMNAPFPSDIDRFDFARSILADCACGISLHYKELCNIHPHRESYILGCGGGFQSASLSQWIADLTGKQIILYKNFHQSSIQGCINICNETLKYPQIHPVVASSFTPEGQDESIHTYYEQWLHIRMENIKKSQKGNACEK